MGTNAPVEEGYPMISELENSWRNLIQLKALKSETGHACMHTCRHGLAKVGELLDSSWINFIHSNALKFEIGRVCRYFGCAS
jgi:hypothetical protein